MRKTEFPWVRISATILLIVIVFLFTALVGFAIPLLEPFKCAFVCSGIIALFANVAQYIKASEREIEYGGSPVVPNDEQINSIKMGGIANMGSPSHSYVQTWTHPVGDLRIPLISPYDSQGREPSLKKQLEEAKEREDYNECARLRDLIKAKK